MFESLGLTEPALDVYRMLLEHPRLTPAELGSQLELPAAEVVAALGLLRHHELLVTRSWGTDAGDEYAIHPSRGFAVLAERRREELEILQRSLRQDELIAQGIVEQYSYILRRRTSRETEVFIGQENANQRMQEFMPTSSIWALISAEFVDAAKPELSPDKPFLDKGMDNRSIYNERHIRNRPGQEYVRWALEHGMKIRTMPSIPTRMVIFDGESVAIPLDSDDATAGVVIHHSAQVVHLSKLFFEQCWRHAADVFSDEPTASAELTAEEAELLQLLVQGATDEQAGRKLGVSLRTVRRMAAKLSEQAGASGRFELGVRAAQRGWVR